MHCMMYLINVIEQYIAERLQQVSLSLREPGKEMLVIPPNEIIRIGMFQHRIERFCF